MSSIMGSVEQVLVATGDQAVLGAGAALNTLAKGQLGVFDAKTNLSVDDSATSRSFYIAVGTGNGDFLTSNIITAADVEAYNTRCASAPQEGVYDLIVGGCTDCTEDYVLRFAITSPSDFYKMGYQPLYKTFVVGKDCCSNCTDCDNEAAICSEVIKKLRDEINADRDGLFTAWAIDPNKATSLDAAVLSDADIDNLVNAQAAQGWITVTDWNGLDGGKTVTVGATTLTEASEFTAETDNATTAGNLATAIDGISGVSAEAVGNVVIITLDAAGAAGNTTVLTTNATSGVELTGEGTLIGGADANAKACPALRIQTVLPTLKDWCNIPETYDFPRNVKLVAAPVEGLACCGAVTERQIPTLEEGSYEEVKYREYVAKGHLAGPYRQTQSGVFIGDASTQVVDGQDYNSMDIHYRYNHFSGNLSYSDPKLASIFIPCASSTTAAGFSAIVDALLPSFDAQANDLALCACNVTNLTSDKAAGTDGIG